MTFDEFKASIAYLGWNQREFARRLGVRPATISDWRSHQHIPQYASEYLRVCEELTRVTKDLNAILR